MASTNGNGRTRQRVAQRESSFVDPILLNQLSAMVGNATSLSRDFNQSVLDPRRDIEDECGYPRIGQQVHAEVYRQLYDREAIANRVVNCMPRECWQVQPEVYEDEDPSTVTAFEKAWDDLGRSLADSSGQSWHQDEEGSPVWEYLKRIDELSGIGRFGVLLLGLDDGGDLSQPARIMVQPKKDGKGPVPDGPMHPDEAEALKNPKETTTFDPYAKVGKDGGPRQTTIPPKPLTNRELQLVVNWERYSENLCRAVHDAQVANAERVGFAGVGQSKPSDDNLKSSDGRDLLGTDANYWNWFGGSPPGTSTQGAGTQGGGQFGPPSGFMGQTDQGWGGQSGQGWGGAQGWGSGPGGSVEVTDPAKKGKGPKLLFLRCFDESLVQVVRYEWNILSPRFGQPVMYRVTLNDPRVAHSGIGLPLATVFVHWSRVIHVADNLTSSQAFGTPRMQPVLNRILDLRKVYGSDGEAAWRNAFQKLFFETHPQLGGDVIIDKDAMRDDLEEMMNGLQQWMATTGMSVKAVPPGISDPQPHADIQIEAICIQMAIPKRVFCGSERGELASSQDDSSWNDRLRARQHTYITPKVIVPFIDRLIMLGVLPEPENYNQPDLPPQPQATRQTKPPAPGEQGAPGKSGFGPKPGGFGQPSKGPPKPPTANVFCPTGPGGGVDATCGKDEGGGGGGQSRATKEEADAATKTAKQEDTVEAHDAAEKAHREVGNYKQAAKHGARAAVLRSLAKYGPPKAVDQMAADYDYEGRKRVQNITSTVPPTSPGTRGGGDPLEEGEDQEGSMDSHDDIQEADGGGDVDQSSGGLDPAKDPTAQLKAIQKGKVENARRGYSVEWPDLDSLSDKDKAAIFQQRVTAYAAAIQGDVASLIPEKAIMTMLDGMDEEEADAILMAAERRNLEDEARQQAMIDEHGFEPLPPEGYHDPENPIPTALNPGQSLHDPQTGEELGASPHEAPQPVVQVNPAQPSDPNAPGGPPFGKGASQPDGPGGKPPDGQGAVAQFRKEFPRNPSQMPPSRNQADDYVEVANANDPTLAKGSQRRDDADLDFIANELGLTPEEKEAVRASFNE